MHRYVLRDNSRLEAVARAGRRVIDAVGARAPANGLQPPMIGLIRPICVINVNTT